MSIRSLVRSEPFLVLPGAHDAVSARQIQAAGFKAYFIGGFPVVGARFGVPDIGLMGLGEIGAAVRDIVSACPLPALVDGDNGYGDVKTIVHALHTYERLGASALMFEDQVSPKRCGHIAGKDIIPAEAMVANIRAVAAERMNPDTFIVARTDARDVVGLDEAFRRADLYLSAGADGLFIESPHDLAELEAIGRRFDVPQMANMLEGGRTPILRPSELGAMGFKILIYGISLLMHSVRAMQGVLDGLTREDLGFVGKGAGFEEFKELVGFQRWAGLEKQYR